MEFYPIDIDAAVQEFKDMHPDNLHGEPILRAILPWVNEAYTQGVEDGKEATK